jgi:hypothetical protein
LTVAGPDVPETVLSPATTDAGNTPVMLERVKRSEKLMMDPPVAAERTLTKEAFVVGAPSVVGNTTV